MELQKVRTKASLSGPDGDAEASIYGEPLLDPFLEMINELPGQRS